MRKNKYPGKCVECGDTVASGAGSISRPGQKWLTFCSDCGDVSVVTACSCSLILHSQGVQVSLDGFADTLYWPFREAIKAAKGLKVGGAWINVLPWDDFAAALRALHAIDGLFVNVSAEVTSAMRLKSETLTDLLSSAQARLAAADAALSGTGLALYDYQRAGVEFLASQSSAMLSDEMGLGKTVQALLALPESADIRCIIVGPAISKSVWVRELHKWRPDLIGACKITVLKGRKSFRVPAPGEIVITNYEILNAVDDLSSAVCFDGVQLIADEAHALKNPKAKRTERFRDLSSRVRSGVGGRVWLLTATPLLGRPPELYSLLSAIGRVPFTSFKSFAVAAGGVEGKWGWEWGTRPIDPSIADAIRPIMLRRMKADVGAQLPELSSRVVDMDLSGSGIRSVLDAALESWDALGDSCPSFDELSRARSLLASAKIPTMLALVEEYEAASEPLVVFSAHRAPIDLLAGREGWAVITGDTSPEARGRIQDAFQAGDLLGVGATIKAGGVAITLTRASNAVMVDLDWTPALNSQAAARVHRLGSERPVMITNILADHALDARLLEILSAKSDLISATVDSASVGEIPTTISNIDLDLAVLADQSDSINAENIDNLDAMAQRVAKWDKISGAHTQNKSEKRWQNLIADRLASRNIVLAASDSCSACEVAGIDRRLALGPIENWVVYALGALVSMDLDHAQVKNGVGFNSGDTMLGHALDVRASEGLSDGEWYLARGMLEKYHKQIGTPPSV